VLRSGRSRLLSRNYVNVIVAGKQPELQWLSVNAAVCHRTARWRNILMASPTGNSVRSLLRTGRCSSRFAASSSVTASAGTSLTVSVWPMPRGSTNFGAQPC